MTVHIHNVITVTCDYPPQLHPIIVINGSHEDSHSLHDRRTFHITYTYPPGFELTGPNASVYAGNGEWEPDPGEVKCKGDNYALHNDATSIKINDYLHTIINQFLLHLFNTLHIQLTVEYQVLSTK